MEPISEIDDSTNQLFFRGINVGELCMSYSYDAVFFLLCNGRLPSGKELDEISSKLIDFRKYYSKDIESLTSLTESLQESSEDDELNTQDMLLKFLSLAPLVVANRLGKYSSKPIRNYNNELGHAANFLWMTKSNALNEIDINDFQTALILHMDDPSNPSLSALSAAIHDGDSIYEALSKALESHAEPSHHGAGTEAMKMFEEMRNESNPRQYLENRLDSGKKIFGLGHRIYTGKDPRSIILERILERRVKGTKNEWLLNIIHEVTHEGHSVLKERKSIEAHPNVDLYNAAVYYSLGYPSSFNTDLFAISRIAGWIAHILEWQGQM